MAAQDAEQKKEQAKADAQHKADDEQIKRRINASRMAEAKARATVEDILKFANRVDSGLPLDDAIAAEEAHAVGGVHQLTFSSDFVSSVTVMSRTALDAPGPKPL